MSTCIIPSLLAVFGLSITPEQCPMLKKQLYPQCENFWQRNFDFIIVGAGSAGSALANRLSEIEQWNVLLIEAGGDPTEATEVPISSQYVLDTSANWKYLSEPMKFPTAYNQNCLKLPQGRVVGGTSTINDLVNIPGQPYDYDKWAKLTKSNTWSWSNVRPYFNKVFKMMKNTTPKVVTEGRIHLEAAVRELGIGVNDQTPFGFKDQPINIIDNVRLSTAKAYLQPISRQKNFCLITKTLVNKIVIDRWTKTAIGVELDDPRNHKTKRQLFMKAAKEIIVSAGAFNSPKLLMLSGLGPDNHLKKLGIPLIRNLPVGQNLQDHYYVPFFLTENEPKSQPPFTEILEIYCQRGILLNNTGIATFLGYFNSDVDLRPNKLQWWTTPRELELIPNEIFKSVGSKNIYGLLNNTNYRTEYSDIIADVNTKTDILMLLVNIIHPKSRGTVLLKDNNTLSPPLISLNFFDHPYDMQIAKKGIQLLKKLKSTQSMSNNTWINLNIKSCNMFDFMSEKYIECYAKMFVGTAFHYAGTCKMGTGAEHSVVDSSLTVHGVFNLRVCDTSVIPELMGGHPSIPAVMIGEKLADIMKKKYLLL